MGTAQSREVVQVVAITATISIILTGTIFYLVYRIVTARRLGKNESDLSFCRKDVKEVPCPEYGQYGGAIKGLVVDDNGVDVLYVRKLEDGHFSGCFPKVEYDSALKKSVPPTTPTITPVPKISDLFAVNPVSQHEHSPFTSCTTWQTPPSPLLTPPSQLDVPLNQNPPPPPPPPPRQLPLQLPPPPPLPTRRNLKPSPPPAPPKLKPALTAKTRGLISPHISLIPQGGTEHRQISVEAPAVESVKANGEVQTRLKPLHWDKVTANSEHSMVWNEINDGSFRFDDELMESLFGYNTASNKSTDGSKSSSQCTSNSAQSAQIFILDPRKSQNIAIVCKSLAVSREEILDALLKGQGLNSDTLEKLVKICPTQEERTKILKFTENLTKLADAEFFLYQILKAVPSAFVRFNAMLFRSTYDQEILHLKECLQTLELGCKELRTGRIFFKLLEAILKAGNRMNAGTVRGNAQGFNLSALCKLSDVKSTNGNTTLLHFVVEQVIRSEGKHSLINRNSKPHGIDTAGNKEDDYNSNTYHSEEEIDTEYLMLGLQAFGCLSSEFSNVKKAATIDYDSFMNTCSTLTSKVDDIKQILTCCKIESVDFLREIKGFVEDSEEELSLLREEEKKVSELVKKTTVYYHAGGSKDKGINPFQLFVIVKDFLGMVDKVCAEITKKVHKKKMANPSSSTPPSPIPRSPNRFDNMKSYFITQKPRTSSSDSEDGF